MKNELELSKIDRKLLFKIARILHANNVTRLVHWIGDDPDCKISVELTGYTHKLVFGDTDRSDSRVS